jgi:uncharacterized hydantoinase/oxoprolinase family protein
MIKLNPSKVKTLLETYMYVYLTELDHRENINDIVSSHDGKSKFEDISYFPMWQRSKKALDNLEEYLRQIIDENDGNTTLRNELEKLKTFNALAEKDNNYINKILKL